LNPWPTPAVIEGITVGVAGSTLSINKLIGYVTSPSGIGPEPLQADTPAGVLKKSPENNDLDFAPWTAEEKYHSLQLPIGLIKI